MDLYRAHVLVCGGTGCTSSGSAQLIERFEKRIHDLKLTRMVSVQMGPQIRLMQTNDNVLAERIQSTIVNTIPLWKSQMVIALGLHRSQQALKAQQAVTDMTNELLKKNAETLKMGTIETAKESERGIIDIETLVKTNQDLIDTINEVLAIQENGRKARREAEKAEKLENAPEIDTSLAGFLDALDVYNDEEEAAAEPAAEESVVSEEAAEEKEEG